MSTIFSDNFNRANGDVGANYDLLEGDAAEVGSNRLLLFNNGTKRNTTRTNTNAHAAVVNVRVTILKQSVGTAACTLNARDSGTGGTRNGYTVDFIGTNVVELGRLNNGEYTPLDDWTAAHEDGDILGLEITGTGAAVTITPLINGSPVGTPYVDTSGNRITTAGHVCIGGFFNGSCFFDDLLVENLDDGGEEIAGSGGLTAGAATLSGSGARGVAGSGAASAAAATLSGVGTRGVVGSGSLSAPSATLDATGSVNEAAGEITGAGDLTTAPATLSGSGIAGRSGVGALTAPEAEFSGVGTRGVRDLPGPIELVFGGGYQIAGEGIVASPGVPGSGELTGPSAELSGSGVRGVIGSGELAAPSVELAASGTRGVQGTGNLIAPAAEISGTAGPKAVTGTGTLTLSGVTLSGPGVRGITGTGALTAPPARLRGTDIISGGGGILLSPLARTRPRVLKCPIKVAA